MKRFNFNIKDRKMLYSILSIVLVCIFTLTIAYSALSAVLTITGNARVSAADWDIYLNNPRVTSGSATTNVPEIKTSSTLEFETTLNMPGDFYEFIVDVVNGGSIDAMIENVIKTPELTAEQAKYLNYEVTYQNGESIDKKQTLTHGSTMPIKVRVEYRRDISASDLPTSQTKLDLSLTLEYVQSDGTGSIVAGNGSSLVSLEGKSALFIGDSVQYGQGNSGKGWSYYIDQNYSMGDVTKVAVSGSSFTKNSTGTDRIINQFKNNTGSYDFVILEGGINDLTYGSTWGSLSSEFNIVENSTIIVEAIEETIYTILTKYPNARVGYIMLYNTEDSGRNGHDTSLPEYHDLLLSIFRKWNIPVFDMYSGSVEYNGETTTFDSLLDVHNTTYLTDGLHLNDAGYQLTYSYIAEWMRTLTTVAAPTISDGSDNSGSGDESVDSGGSGTTTTPEEETTTETVKLGSGTFTAVNTISGLKWTKDMMVTQTGVYASTSSTGRVASVGYLLKVSGGETISITDGTNYNFSFYEFDANNSSTGFICNSWIADSKTLNSNTQYVKFYLKKTSEVAWTDDEINNIPNLIKIS